MPKVPALLPEIGADATALPMSRAGADPRAFGSGVGEGLGDIGKALSRAGDELFQRAYALQDLKNQTEAKEAETQYIISLSTKHADFQSLQGKQAVDAFPAYQKDLQETRAKIRDGMTNDMSRKMFDSTSLTTMGRTIFSGAGHAATQNKRWAMGASAARVAALGDQALGSPADEGQFRQSLGSVRAEVEQQGQLAGWSPEQVEQTWSERRSELWAKRIEGMAKQAPFTAKKMLDDATKRGEIRGEISGKVQNYVQQHLYTVGARNLSNEISTGSDLYFGSKIVSIDQAADAIGEFESGNNYQALGKEVFDRKTGASRGRALGKYQVMPENLPGWLKEAGLPSMTPQEFLKDGKAQEQLFRKVFGRIMSEQGNFNDAASVWFSGEPMAKAGGRSDGQTTVPGYIRATNAILARNTPLTDRVARGREVAAQISPDNPLLQDYVEARIQADFGSDQRIRANDQFLNRQIIEGGLMGGPNGRLPTTLEELKAIDPKIDAAWARLDHSKQRQYLGVLAQNAKGDRAWTEENLREYQKLKGLAQVDPAGFIDTDVMTTGLPTSAKKEFINLQTKLKAKAEQDPRVTRALNVLGSDLFAAGITRKQDEEGYLRFVGRLQDAIASWTEETKKQPSPQDIQTIGARLMREQTTRWMLNPWGTGQQSTAFPWSSGDRFFNLPVPDADNERIKNDPAWAAKGIEPTDEMIQRIYIREQYQKLYGGTAGAPTVPQSK